MIDNGKTVELERRQDKEEKKNNPHCILLLHTRPCEKLGEPILFQNCVRSEEYLPLYWRAEAKVESVSVERGFIPSRSGLAATISTRVKTASLGKEINIPWLLTLKECCWKLNTRRDLNLCSLYFTRSLCHR